MEALLKRLIGPHVSLGNPTPSLLDFGSPAFPLHELPFLGWGALCSPAPGLGDFSTGKLAAFCSPFLQLCREAFTGQLPVHRLTPGITDCHREASGQVGQGDGGGDLVDMLAARSRGAGKALPQILVAEYHGFHGLAF